VETTKLSGSSRDVHDYLRALACSRHQRVAVPANRRLNNLREMSRSITRDKRRSVEESSVFKWKPKVSGVFASWNELDRRLRRSR